jgi:hypothetical protein
MGALVCALSDRSQEGSLGQPLRIVLVVAALLAGIMTAAPIVAQEKEIATLKAVLAEGALDQSLFSAEFLKAVPPAQLEPAVQGIKDVIGPVVAVTHQGGPTYLVETATHEMSSDIVLDASDKIVGLFFRPPVASTATIDDLLEEMAAIASQSAFLVTEKRCAASCQGCGHAARGWLGVQARGAQGAAGADRCRQAQLG